MNSGIASWQVLHSRPLESGWAAVVPSFASSGRPFAEWHLLHVAGTSPPLVPVPPWLLRAGEVADIVACQGRRSVRREVLDGIEHQLNDVLGVVGEGAGILQDDLVIVGGLEQSRRPRHVLVGAHGLVRDRPGRSPLVSLKK